MDDKKLDNMAKEKRNMDTIMSKKELIEFCQEKWPNYPGDDDDSMNIDQIKKNLGIHCKVRFQTCKNYPNSSIAWINVIYENNLEKLLMLRISTHTLHKVVKGKDNGVEFDLLSYKFYHSGNTSKDVAYDEYHITAHNEFDPYREPVDPDPDGSRRIESRNKANGYDDSDWGGLYGEEADLGRWNCD